MRPPGAVTIPYLIDWEALKPPSGSGFWRLLPRGANAIPMLRSSISSNPMERAGALLHRLTDSQLVVLGGRNRSLVARALLGSTFLNLLHHSPVPVTLCRTSSGDQ